MTHRLPVLARLDETCFNGIVIHTDFDIPLPHNPGLAVTSHGWPNLHPLATDGASLHWFTRLPHASVCRVSVTWDLAHRLSVSVSTAIDEEDTRELTRRMQWMFRADEDFSGFQRQCEDHPALAPCARLKAGALLRSESLFEDVVKTLCTTNCHWRNTKRMVLTLCQMLGEPCLDPLTGEAQGFTFPTPERVAAATEPELAAIGFGYRAKFIQGFARDLLAGAIDIDGWHTAADPDALRERLLRIPGIGPYSANHMLMLTGHYAFIPCDSEVCAYLGLPPITPAATVTRLAHERYQCWGSYAYLAYKFERVMRARNYVDC